MLKRNQKSDFITQDSALVIPDSVPVAGHRQYVITKGGFLYKVWGFVKSPGKPLSVTRQAKKGVKGDVPWYMYVTLLTADYVVVGGVIDVPSFRRVSVHRLVCAAFHGPQPEGKPWVNHKDGVKNNNHADNLEWSSISENVQHAHDTGLVKKVTGSDHWNFGKVVSASTRTLMAAKKTGENHPKFKGWWELNGKRYCSLREAAAESGLSVGAVKKDGQFYAVGSYSPIEIGPMVKDIAKMIMMFYNILA